MYRTFGSSPCTARNVRGSPTKWVTNCLAEARVSGLDDHSDRLSSKLFILVQIAQTLILAVELYNAQNATSV